MNLSIARWLMPAALPLWAAWAQAQPLPPAPAAAMAPATAPSAPALHHPSAIRNYQRFSETRVIPWRAANDSVAQAGGWRAYAREARQPDDAAKEAPGSPAPAGAAQAQPGARP